MSKEKIKKVMANNQRKILATLLILLALLLIVGIGVNASKNNDDYVVEIKDDGSLNIAEDEHSSVTKKIVADTPRSLTYELQVKNLAPSSRIPEVAIVVDSSRSMGINDPSGAAKQKAIQFVTELRNYSPRSKISLSSNSGVKTGMSTSALATYTNAINAIGYSDGESVAKAIDYAAGSFSSNDTDKYLVIFSDATDSIKDKLELLTNNGIEIYSMLAEITNSEYQNSELMGTTKMLSEIEDFSKIYHKTNKSLLNVELTDIFSSEAIEYFDFEIVSKENDLELEKNSNGYILKCNDIKAGETRTLKYTMTIKDNKSIDSAKVYRTLNSSDNISIKYKNYLEEDKGYETQDSPTYVICRKYSLTIKAVSEKSNDLPIKDLDVKVVGTTVTGQDEAGNDIVKTIFDDTLKTDAKGRIIIDDLKTLGDIKFEIKPLVNQFGYVETSATQILVHNDPTGVGTIWAESDVTTPDVDVVSRNITVLLPISVQTYDMIIETIDMADSRIKLGNIEYRLIQPKLNSKYEMEALYGESDENGNLVLKPAVMTKDGSYQYILSQMSHQDGYDEMGNVTLIVTFENGKVTKIAREYNQRVSTELINNTTTKVTVGNAAEKDDTFFLEIDVKDDLTGDPLFGAMYDILVTRTTMAGKQVSSPLHGYMSDENGKIKIEIPGTGYINLKITETAPKAGYVADTQLKEITFLRKEGTVQYISSKNPTTIDAIADTDNNTIKVNLKSKLANEQNRIQVHLVDRAEPDANIPGVLLAVNRVGDKNLTYATTNRDGIANFIIANEEKGSYQYEISLFSSAPKGYLTPGSAQLGVITVQFDENGHAISASEVSHTTPTINVSFDQMLEEGFLYDTAKVDLGLEPDPTYAYNLKIALLDGSNMKKGIAGAKYSILMESDGEEVKYLAGKLTDANGNYNTRIVGGGQNITITITETATLKGYILTTTPQVIELELTDSGYQIANSSPNIYDPANGEYRGAELKNKELIYHDVNNSKTGANTVLNLHVNKMDTNDFLVSGVRVKLSSETLLGADGKPLDEIREVTDEEGNVSNRDYYITDQNGYFEILGIKVKGDELNNGERVDYLYMNEVDGKGNIIDNTDITLKITFRLNDNTAIVEVTNVEATWGNRLLKNKTYSSRESEVAYESDVYLDIFTNFDDVGNFSLDLKKVNKYDEVLPGAKYDIVVTRPDGTTLVRRDVNVRDNVELEGILVSKGTKIEVTEKQAPMGYNINHYTEVLTITEVNTITGLVTCELEQGSYSTPRAKISNTQPIVTSDGTYKLSVTLDLIDYEMDTFKFGITTKDSQYQVPIEGYTFSISTTEGAQKNTPKTDKEGKTSVQVGANYKIENYEVTYTINTLKVANYYKKLPYPIQVKIIFDLNGNVASALTNEANKGQQGYGTIWNIEKTNAIDGNDIDIVLNIDPCDPLVLNVQTRDTLTNKELTNIEYALTPTINLSGKGTTKLQSGYVLPDGTQTYKITQTNASAINNYESIPEQQIKVVYDSEGNIESLEELTSEVHKISTNGKEATIKIDIEPRVPFTIKDTAYFGGANVVGSKYKITLSENDNREVTTDPNGEAVTYIGKFGTETSEIYTVKQIMPGVGYASIDEFQIEVFFDAERNIVDAKLLGNVNENIDFVTITHTRPSTNAHKGYNGNDKGIVNISIRSYPEVQFEIENIDRVDNTIKLAGTTYKVESTINTKDESVVTASNGIGTAHLDRSGFNTRVRYTITELKPAPKYQSIEIVPQIDVDFDEKGFITNVEVVEKEGIVEAKLPGQKEKLPDQEENNEEQGENPPAQEDNIEDTRTDVEKFKVELTIKSNPAVQFEIENVDRRNENIKLSGTQYKVESDINTKDESVLTDANGIGIADLDRSGFNKTVKYTITELSPAARYQTLAINPEIEVDFNELGYITDARVTKREDVVEVSLPEQLTSADKFKVNIKIKNNPELKLTITKVDEEDENILIPKVDFEITARIIKDNLSEYTESEIGDLTLKTSELTEEDYLLQVIDRLKINREDIEDLKQTVAIQNFIEELKNDNKLSAEEEDQINEQTNNNKKINKIVELGKATKTQMQQKVNSITNRKVLDDLIAKGETTEDRVNELLETVKKQVRLDVDNVTTNQNGIAIAYMDKTLANKTIEYTIRETKKATGYDWLDEVVIFEVTYDAQGKMVADEPVKVVSGQIDINSINQDNFEIAATIKNKPSQEVYIHLSVEDVYDSNKKLETAKFDAHLISKYTTVYDSYIPDNKYRVALQTGSTTTGTNLALAHGEDTESIGVYEEGAGTRTLRLVQKQTPSSYYIGTDKFDSAYQSIAYAMLIDVTFNDEGKVTGASLHSPGGDTRQIGYIADGRYLQVSHTRNTINITVRYYPMLQIQMQTVDKYTKQSLQGSYTLSTDYWDSNTNDSEIVKSGYINPHAHSDYYYGRTYSAGYTTNKNLTSIDNAARIAVGPTEADNFAQNVDSKERIFYLYENAEPNSPIQYQTYLPRYINHSSDYLIARLKVKYDELGQVESVEVLDERSSTNIKSGFTSTVKASVNEHTIQIIVEYAPITTITATVIDEVSGAGLSGIRINPYLGGTDVTSTSYEYRYSSDMYYTTGSSGRTGWTYWGASKPDSLNRYILDTYTYGSGYEGYFDPGNVILDVAYDENGRIASVTPKSTDAFGDVNAVNISWSNNNIQVTIRYSRKFNVQLNKVDYFDSNKRLNAAFDLVSGTGTRVSMAANTVTTLGKVYPGRAVKYTLSETTAPNGYIPVENLDIIVQFNNNGSIRSAKSDSSYYQFLNSAPVDQGVNSLRKVDLVANIKNKPRFDVSIELSDKFYPTLKLEGGTFTIENNKGDSAAGGVQTDKNGIMQTYVGTTYPNEEVIYTVKQTNVIPGYYENNTIMKFKIRFNANGKIEDYSIIDGTNVATMNPSNHIGKQAVTLYVTNKPKDVKLGMYKYDGLTNTVMQDVSFKLKTEEVGKKASEKTVVTNSDGTAVDVVDTFVEKTTNRVVKYTISEIQAAKSYRKIQDVVIQVTYKQDGSIYLYDVLSNPSGVGVEVATNKQIKYAGSVPVHIKLTIPNDNAYDVIVKNEDTNFAGLGIEGTTYDIAINGENKGPITTNKNGIATVKNQTQTGIINIAITERTIGEGYRENNNNTTVVQVEKGVEEYTLELKGNSNDTYATVVVDEEHGTVTVTFKNETKLELTMQKEDINTGALLEGAEFEIREVELDSKGNEIEGTENIITAEKVENPGDEVVDPVDPQAEGQETEGTQTEGSEGEETPEVPEVKKTKITGKDGLLYFDLGLSKQNKTVKYTFTEVTPPTGYTQIFPINVTVKFDEYGHIISMKDDSIRAQETLTSNTGKSHHMIVVIGNGTINEAYTVKILTEDSVSGMRINGSIFQVQAIEEATGSTNKSLTGVTKDVTRTIAGNLKVFDKGALRVTGITAEGDVAIKFKQIESATGYVYDDNQTSGTVKIHADFELVDNETAKEVTLSKVDDGGFDVDIDNINREITIKVKNKPQVDFEITKIDADTKAKMEGAKFHITSAIVQNGVATPTDFAEDAKVTDKNGYTLADAGTPYAGKTVIYTLTEDKIEEYDELDEIILSVQYDTSGNIAESKILSSKDDITIRPDGSKKISKRVMTNEDRVGVVEIDYDTIEVPTGTGSRILQMEIKNYRTPIPKDYQIQIGKYHEDTTYPYLIPGAKYEINVTQEYGKESTTWTDITDENGIITSPYFSGHGLIEVSIKELAAPDGYKLDGITRTTRFIRYETSQKMVIESTDSGCTFNDDFTMVYLKAVDETVAGEYSIVINNADVKNGALIAQNPSQIKLEMIEEHETVTERLDEETGEVIQEVEKSSVRVPMLEQETDENGRIVVNRIKTPTKEGEYTYVLSQPKASKGYNKIQEDEVEFLVTFEKNEDEEMIITGAKVKGNVADVRVARTSNKVMSIIVYNEKEADEGELTLKDNEIGFDIRSVDKELYQVTTGIAEYILKDAQTEKETTITTDELGRAEMLKIKMPVEAGNYRYILKQTKAPKGFKVSEAEMYILLEFAEDEEGKIYLSKATTEGSNLVYANKPEDGELPERKLMLKVINEDIPYTLVIEKHHESDPFYPCFIPDVEFDIKVTQEYGEKTTEWTEITNKDGIIVRENFAGYGRIKVEIVEKSAPDKYQAIGETKFLEFNRDKYSKELREYDSNVGYELDEENQRIILKPVNEMVSGIYDIVINKVDKTNNTIITKNPAEFNLYMVNKYITNEEEVNPETGETQTVQKETEVKVPIIQNEQTNDLGMLIKDAISMPEKEGVYTFELQEVKAPNGYEGLKENVRLEVTIILNEKNELIINDVKVLNQTDKVKVLAIRDQLITLSVGNENAIPEGSFALDITKVDVNQKAITSDTAVFKLTEEQTKNINYLETVKSTGNGYLYVNKPTKAGVYTYTLNEIKAPEGYALDRSDIKVKLTFEQNAEGALYISKAEIEGENAIYEQLPEGQVPGNKVALKIKNEVGANGGANDKPYTLVINKIDSETSQLIKERATFDVSLVNGEIVHASTNENGQMIIENVYMPSTPGQNEIIIKETNAPKGYILDSEMKVVNVTFSGLGKEMVITNVELGKANSKNIQIVEEECTEDKIVLNILNTPSGYDPLYVVSRKYSNGVNIYDVLKQFQGSQYSINEPFIDTKVAKYGNNPTVQQFIDNLESNGTMTVLDEQGNVLKPTDRIQTKMTLKAVKGNEVMTFKIVVKGDVYFEGKGKERVRITDLNVLTRHMSKEEVITDPILLRALDLVTDKSLAGEVEGESGDGRIRTTDLNEFYKVIQNR